MKAKMEVNKCTEVTIKTSKGEVQAYNLNLVFRYEHENGDLKHTKADSYFVRNDKPIEVGKIISFDLSRYDIVISTKEDDKDPTKMVTFKWLRLKSPVPTVERKAAVASTVSQAAVVA